MATPLTINSWAPPPKGSPGLLPVRLCSLVLGPSSSANPNPQTRLVRAWDLRNSGPGRTKWGPCDLHSPHLTPPFPKSPRPFPRGQFFLARRTIPAHHQGRLGCVYSLHPPPSSSKGTPTSSSSHLHPRSVVSSLQTKTGPAAAGKAPEPPTLGCKLLAYQVQRSAKVWLINRTSTRRSSAPQREYNGPWQALLPPGSPALHVCPQALSLSLSPLPTTICILPKAGPSPLICISYMA